MNGILLDLRVIQKVPYLTAKQIRGIIAITISVEVYVEIL